MNFIKLPNGNRVNLDRVACIYFCDPGISDETGKRTQGIIEFSFSDNYGIPCKFESDWEYTDFRHALLDRLNATS